jgi:hypothetical protein
MIAALFASLVIAASAPPDPYQFGPIRLGQPYAQVSVELGPSPKQHVCDALHVYYTDASGLLDLTLRQRPGEDVDDISVTPGKVPTSATTAKIRAGQPQIGSWKWMGFPIFAVPAHVPGFVVIPGGGRSVTVHLRRTEKPSVDYVRFTDGSVDFRIGGP